MMHQYIKFFNVCIGESPGFNYRLPHSNPGFLFRNLVSQLKNQNAKPGFDAKQLRLPGQYINSPMTGEMMYWESIA